MTIRALHKDGDETIHFSSSDFLKEALDDFLESGANTSRFASAIIKVATGLELLLKDLLEQVCPALVLDKVDDPGLQVAKIFNLGKQMRSPKELESVELRTAPFLTLLDRANKFFDIADAIPHLRKLHKIRNALIHHRGSVEMLDVNLLLVRYIFPLVQRLSKVHKHGLPRIPRETWAKVQEIERQSVNAISSQLAKKIAHHSKVVESFSNERTSVLAASNPESKTAGADLIDAKLSCPACKFETLAGFRDYDVDVHEGVIIGGGVIPYMSCRVCGLELEDPEIQYIVDNFKQYLGDREEEKELWRAVIELESLDWDQPDSLSDTSKRRTQI
jgi:hypothetical protein